MAAHPSIDVTIVNTGQHYDDNMLGGFLRELDVPKPHVDLGVGSAAAVLQTAVVLERFGHFLSERHPDCVCVFGDTNSTLAAGLAAVKAGFPLVHVEAGCRSFDMRMPEEVNRRVVDHISSLLLPVSSIGAENLRREAVLGSIEIVGDPQFDVFSRQPQRPTGAARTRGLITIHRPENADNPERIRLVLEEIAASGAEVDWVFPIHPRTRRSIGVVPPEIKLCEPLLYAQLLDTLFEARICVTDSGGLQKEAFWARVPCVTVRSTTEWMETVHAGANVLAQPGENLTSAVAASLELTLDESYQNPYGDGHGSEEILDAIIRWGERGATGSESGTS